MEPKAPHANCSACPLRNSQMVPSDPINKMAGYAIVGESPGREELLAGKAFVGWSGKFLWSVLEQCGVRRGDCNVTNAVLCAPPAGEEKQEILGAAAMCCKPRLMHELKQMPGRILTLGKAARDSVFGPQLPDEEYDTLHGRFTKLDVDGNERVALSTLHPAFIMREPDDGKTCIDDIAKAASEAARWKHTPTYEIVSGDRVVEVLQHLKTQPHISFDIETDQVDFRYDKILLLAVATGPDHAYIFPGRHPGAPEDVLYKGAQQQYWKDFWSSESEFIGHNAKFDQKFLRWQIGWRPRVDFDTMLAHYALDERKGTHGLKQLSARFLNVPDYERGLRTHLKSANDLYSKIPWPVLCQYAAWDVVNAWDLRFELEKRLKADNTYEWPFRQILMPASEVFHESEILGIKIDVDYLDSNGEAFQKELDAISAEMLTLSEGVVVNMNSWQQLAVLLYDKMRLPAARGRKLKPRATSKEAIEKLLAMPEVLSNPKAVHVLRTIRRFRRIAKMKGSYVDNLLEQLDDAECTHYDAQLHGAEHGRISIKDPAVQTIPRADEKEAGQFGKIIKDSFVARDGYVLVGVDYSQAELRAAAALAMCKYLLDAYEHDRDVHGEVAKGMIGPNYTKEDRVHTKMFNFSYLYGGSEYSFAQDAGLPIDKARQFVHDYDKLMPELKAWKIAQWDEMRRQGFVVGRTGRKRRIPFVNAVNADEARKASFNSVDAGTSSDLTMLSAIRVHREYGYRILVLVHDSMILEVPEGQEKEVAANVVRIMEEAGRQIFPEVKWKAEAEVGKRWGSMKAIEWNN